MKRYCLLLSAMLLCFLCACSVTEQNERTTMYDIMESGTEEEIAAAAKDAQESTMSYFSWQWMNRLPGMPMWTITARKMR